MTAKNKKLQPKRRFRLVWVVLVLAVFIGELLFYTWCRVQYVHTGYAIAAETRRQQELKMLQNNLKIEQARLKAPENLSRIARQKLALGMPEAHQIVSVPYHE
jgi:cell division protein FtsL